MASDKRVILSSKRARSRRKKAARNANAEPAAPECATLLLMPTATRFSNASKEDAANGTTVTVHMYDEQQKHEPRRCDRASQETTSEEDDELEEDEEDGVVIVCRPTMPDFCTRFVPEVHHPMTPANSTSISAAPDLRSFTASIPSFRETRDGFITYTIALTLCHDPCKQFVVERRFSDFVALAATLNQSSGWLSGGSDAALQFQGSLPSKTWFRVTQVTTLEERRGKLQSSLQELLAQDDGTSMPQLPALRDFLMLDIFGAQIVEEKLLQHD